MNRRRGWAALALGAGLVTGLATGLVTGRPALGQEAEFDGLVAGPGAAETFYACAACHSIKLVSQQGLSRDSWIETLQWMVDEQEMEPLPPDEHELILAYLTTFYGPDRRGAALAAGG
ncbi:MAG: aldehyde dehydrogenase [Pseudomonadota bacterium]|nr:aldehyde dehydrogenase [Pseudomonadota bacterium]